MASSTIINGVIIYNFSSTKVAPHWISQKKKKELQKDIDYRRRVELLQDFGFPEASHSICMSGDGRYIVATGTYPPRVRVYDTTELSMKFERYMDSIPVSTCVLGDDYGKLAFLQEDRNIEVHAAYGKHYRTRVPRAGRHMVYHSPTAELLVAASDRFVYRMNLSEGRFMAPMETNSEAVNKIAISPVTAMIALACENGTVEFWDPRNHTRVSTLDVGVNVTCCAFQEDGLLFVVGTFDGRCFTYDLRNKEPIAEHHHPHGDPVLSVKFHRGDEKVIISLDRTQCRIWKRDTGKMYTVIETTSPVNDFLVITDDPKVGGKDSGLIAITGEQERVLTYYIPSIGLAPRWNKYIDSIVEENQESAENKETAVFEDYKFVTQAELASMGLSHLIGTNLLRAYMHGYFMDARLHAKVKSVVAPDAYANWKEKKVREALEQERSSRIKMADDLPAVNRSLALKLRGEEVNDNSLKKFKKAREDVDSDDDDDDQQLSKPKKKSSSEKASSILMDDRFSKMFSDPAFAIEDDEALEIAARRGAALKGKNKKGGNKGRREVDSDVEDD